MNEQKRKEERTHPINYILLAASLIVFGSLGLVFITQMELQPGWVWEEVSGENSMEMSVLEADDLNKDGFLDAIAYIDVERQDSDNVGDPNDLTNYGNIYALDGLSGYKIWEKICKNPVKKFYLNHLSRTLKNYEISGKVCFFQRTPSRNYLLYPNNFKLSSPVLLMFFFCTI